MAKRNDSKLSKSGKSANSEKSTKGEKSANSEKRRTIIIIIIVIMLAASLCLAAFEIADSVSGKIIQNNISAMEEIALHDQRSIKNSLDIRWTELEKIASQLQRQDFLDDADVSAKLRDVTDNVTSADFLMLVSNDGIEYRSTGLINNNSDLNNVLENYSARFVSRYNESSVWKENNKEMLVMGVPVDIKSPNANFKWLMCRLSISTLENELKIDSYQGKGFSSVIDTEGNYIINISRRRNIGTYDNFFNDLGNAIFEGYNSIDDVRAAAVTGNSASIVYTAEDGKKNIMVITKMGFVDWLFITTVPMSVFDAQTLSIMMPFWILLATIIFIFTVVFLLSIHQRRQSELLKLAEAESKAKTSFLFNMSHDIRTPMNAILGFTDIAITHIDDKERVADSLKKIKGSGSLLLSLINDILEMSRIEAGKIDIVRDPVDMMNAGNNINPMIASLAMAKNIHYSFSAGNVTDRYVYIDVQHMNRVLVNLLTNAVKYTNQGGSVSFAIEQDRQARNGEASYKFIIADTGVGMHKDFIENNLYQQFSREKTSTLSKQQGTGLGLAIAKRIVDALGGKIDVESEVGKGTTFTVAVTLKLQSEEDIEKTRMISNKIDKAEKEFELAGKKALLVEDNELNREIGTVVLAEAGITVDTAEDGSLALDAIKAKGIDYYDFVLMDIQMPVMDGYEATRQIRRLPDGHKAKIIAVSANAFAEDKRKSEEAGMNDHIAKPIDIDELISTLKKYI